MCISKFYINILYVINCLAVKCYDEPRDTNKMIDWTLIRPEVVYTSCTSGADLYYA